MLLYLYEISVQPLSFKTTLYWTTTEIWCPWKLRTCERIRVNLSLKIFGVSSNLQFVRLWHESHFYQICISCHQLTNSVFRNLLTIPFLRWCSWLVEYENYVCIHAEWKYVLLAFMELMYVRAFARFMWRWCYLNFLEVLDFEHIWICVKGFRKLRFCLQVCSVANAYVQFIKKSPLNMFYFTSPKSDIVKILCGPMCHTTSPGVI